MIKFSDIKILVVDDNVFSRNQLVKIISGRGFIVEGASGGREAVECYGRNPADIIITDFNMPEINGLRLAELLLEIKPDLPVVLVSALDDKEMLAQAIQLGVKQYIAKPIDISQLINTVESIAENIYLTNEIRSKLNQFSILTRASSDIIVIAKDDGEIQFSNNMFQTYISPELASEKNLFSIFSHYNQNEIKEQIMNCRTKKTGVVVENLQCFENKSFRCSIGLWTNENEPQFVIIMHDMTLELENRKNEQLFNNVFRHSVEGILITDSRNNIVTCNEAFSIISGYSIDEIRGKNPNILKSGRHDAVFYKKMWDEIKQNGCWSGKLYNRRKDGGIYYEFISIFAIYNDSGEVTNYAALFSDLSRKQNEDDLSKMAYFDMLTNLPNRFYFNEHIRKASGRCLRQKTGLALIYFDLDGFKKINDLYGHQVGDQLLMDAADRLRESLGESDITARMGGDEFAVVLSDAGDDKNLEQAAKKVAEKILKTFKDSFICFNKKINISASIGISMFPKDSDNINDLLKFADISMYESKKRNKNIYTFYNGEINAKIKRELHLEQLLKHCRMDDEFSLFLQPQICLKTDKIKGAELLLRWKNQAEGVISPAEFIPVAENSGIIFDIDKWVIKKAGEIKNHLAGLNINLPISINLSPKSIESAEHTKSIIEKLDKHLSEGNVIIEITESALVTNISNLMLLTEYADNNNISVAIDDFGTGYSSLSYLKNINAKFLKIDKTFIDDIAKSPNLITIIEAIVKMAQTMGMKTVAEGVEEDSQSVILKNLGCDFFQGYLFSKAVDIEDFVALLRKS